MYTDQEFQKEIQEIKKHPGEMFGFSLAEDLDFILKKEGEEGLKKVEQTMEEVGFPLKRKEIKRYQPYPLSLNLMILIVARYVFHWEDKIFREMGRTNAQLSMMAKLMMKYFVSMERTLQEIDRYWNKYYTVGRLRAEEVNVKDRYLILFLRGFPGHPLFCRTLEGYMWQTASYTLPKETLKIEEIECPFSGGEIHKFKLTW